MIDPRRLPAWAWIAAGAGVALLLLRKTPIAEDAASLTEAAAGFVGDVAGGIFQGLAAVVGVPTAGQEKCCNAIAAYGQAAGLDKMKAAFAVSARCPAGDYLTWAAGKGSPAYCKASAAAKPAVQTGRGASGAW
jgi:hypothetical protein